MLTIFAEARRNPDNRDEWLPVLRINGVARVCHDNPYTSAPGACAYASREIGEILNAILSDLGEASQSWIVEDES